MNRNKIAIIIGAGPAGLVSAYKLLTETDDVKPVILECSDTIGGISKTIDFNSNFMEIGPHRFFTKNSRVLELWNYFLSLDENSDENDDVMLKCERLSEILYLKKLFSYPVSMDLRTIKKMGIARTFKCGISYIKSCILKRKEVSLEDFFINRFGKVLYEMFFEKYTEKVWGRHPKVISKTWGEQRIKSLSLIKTILGKLMKSKERSLIDEFYYPKFGCKQLWDKILKEILARGGVIHYNSRVIGLINDEDKIKSVNVIENGEEKIYDADYVFSSMPVKDLINGLAIKTDEISKLANDLPYREHILVGLELKDLNLKNDGKLTRDSWIYIQENDVKVGRICILNSWSPYLLKNKENVLVGLEYFCNENDEYWKMNPSEFIEFAVSELVQLGLINEDDVISSKQIKTKKAYPAYFDSYSEFDKIKEFLNGIKNLYCIGRNGQHRYNNMDHSMLSGIVAVDVLNNKSTINDLWNVNSEEVYHEIKNSVKNVTIN